MRRDFFLNSIKSHGFDICWKTVAFFCILMQLIKMYLSLTIKVFVFLASPFVSNWYQIWCLHTVNLVQWLLVLLWCVMASILAMNRCTFALSLYRQNNYCFCYYFSILSLITEKCNRSWLRFYDSRDKLLWLIV